MLYNQNINVRQHFTGELKALALHHYIFRVFFNVIAVSLTFFFSAAHHCRLYWKQLKAWKFRGRHFQRSWKSGNIFLFAWFGNPGNTVVAVAQDLDPHAVVVLNIYVKIIIYWRDSAKRFSKVPFFVKRTRLRYERWIKIFLTLVTILTSYSNFPKVPLCLWLPGGSQIFQQS